MNEIKRILKTDGILLARVASVNDFNFGAGVGEEREKNFYFEGDYTKRFFDLEDVNRYFGIIGSVEAEETSMTRDEEEYSKSKILYKVKVMNISRSGYYKWLKTKDILNQYKINRRDFIKIMSAAGLLALVGGYCGYKFSKSGAKAKVVVIGGVQLDTAGV